MKKRLFIFEKMSCLNNNVKILNQSDVAIFAPSISSYKFDYQEINFKNAPYTKETPLYKINPLYESGIFASFEVDFNGVKKNNQTLEKISKLKSYDEIIDSYLLNFDEIIFACDFDYTGIRAFVFKLEFFFHLGQNWAAFFKERDIQVNSLNLINILIDNNDVEISPLFDNEYLMDQFKNYLKKDYFEYNYNLNSLIFFNQALREVGVSNPDTVLTKNYIWTLFKINENSLNEYEFINLMIDFNIGSTASRSQIIMNLMDMGLIKYNKERHLLLTEVGQNFLKKLHKKINDPFIGNRLVSGLYCDLIEQNSKTSVNHFKFKFEKYLYSVFSKQKRFLRQTNR